MNYSTTATPVYPRWRGELQTGRHVWLTANGLSPLARGTPITQGRQCGPFRFIPAGAGNSFTVTQHKTRSAVYPRWRGELCFPTTNLAMLRGLSPLARGTPQDRASGSSRDRFIPAGAGNSRKTAKITQLPPVYPRWRGELSSNNISRSAASGLSPLARGTL